MGLHKGAPDRCADLGQARLLCEAAGAALFFRDVGDMMVRGEVAFEELDQDVGETAEVRRPLLRDRGVGPGPLGPDFVFEFVKLFSIFRRRRRRKAMTSGGSVNSLVRNSSSTSVAGCVWRMRRRTIPAVVATSSAAVIPMWLGLGPVDGVFARHRQVHFFLGQGDEVDAAALFPFLPMGVLDAGAIVDGEDFATGGGVMAQRVAIKAPSAAPRVVFLFALGEGQVGERLDLPVESEAVADRALCAGEGIGEDSRPGQGRSAAERSPSRRPSSGRRDGR